MPKDPVMTLRLRKSELDLILEALDSHIYWQLSEPNYRKDGYVLEPGSDDEEMAEEIREAEKLIQLLEGFRSKEEEAVGKRRGK